MRILGIDPGFGRMGWGVVEGEKHSWKHVAHGCLQTNARAFLIDRLEEIHKGVAAVITQYTPDISAVEKLFFNTNVKTAMDVGQARGVILLTLVQAQLRVYEYTPLEVKQAVVGYGKAEKMQVQKMVAMQLHLLEERIQDDAADALAVALTCAVSVGSSAQLRQ